MISYKIANLGFNFKLSDKIVDRQELFDTFIFPTTVYSLVLRRSERLYTGERIQHSIDLNTFSNQVTIKLCSNNTINNNVLLRVKLFTSGVCQVSKSNTFEDQLNTVHMLRNAFRHTLTLPDMNDICMTSTSSNISIIVNDTIDLQEFYKFYKNENPTDPFYNVMYNAELSNAIRMISGQYSYRVFRSGKVTCLGKGVNAQEDVNDAVARFTSMIQGYLDHKRRP